MISWKNNFGLFGIKRHFQRKFALRKNINKIYILLCLIVKRDDGSSHSELHYIEIKGRAQWAYSDITSLEPLSSAPYYLNKLITSHLKNGFYVHYTKGVIVVRLFILQHDDRPFIKLFRLFAQIGLFLYAPISFLLGNGGVAVTLIP